MPIYLVPLDDFGDIRPLESFEYVWNITTNSDCTGVLYSNTSIITTDKYGRGFIDLNLDSMTGIPFYLCEYRNGTFRKSFELQDQVFRNVYAKSFIGNGSELFGITQDNSSWNKSYADTLYRTDSWNNFTGIPHATPSNGDTTHFSLADEIFDWVTSLGYLTSITNIFDQSLNTTDSPTFVNITATNFEGDSFSNLADGTAQGQMAFWDASLGKWVQTETSELFWDDVNKRLGIGTATPSNAFMAEGPSSGGYRTGLGIDNDDSSFGPTIYGYTSRDSYERLFFRGNLIASSNQNIVFGSGSNYNFKYKTSPLPKFQITSTDVDGIGSFGEVLNILDGSQIIHIPGQIGLQTITPQATLHNVGTTRLGDQATNYMSVASDGEIGLTGTARVKKKLYVDANGIKSPGANPASFVEDGLTGCWEFDDAIEANQESVSGTLLIPSDMDITVVPTFNIGWHADGISPGDTVWQFEYLWRSPNEDVSAVAQETLADTFTASASSNGLVIASITGIDLPSATDKAMFWKITRLSAHANDTIADVTHLRGEFFEYTANKLGESL